ncbi:MAG: hypothetical protein K9J13_16745 [Saprospiraceae bacterium]|nr:hypothetical protein [Saprospiraceae bacterium]
MTKKIKTETSWKHDLTINSFHDEEVVEKAYKSAYKEYDENGNTICDITYDRQGGIAEKYLFKYDENGNLIEEIIYFDEEEIVERISYERNSEGEILKEFNHYLDDTYDTTEYMYENGKIIKKVTTDSDGDSDGYEQFVYDGDKLLLFEKFDDENELIEKNSYRFDENGNEIENSKWNKEDDAEIIVKTLYNEAGQKNKIQQYNNKKQLVAIVSFEYSDKGVINKVIEEGRNGKTILNLIHDEKGNVIVQEELAANDEINHRVERKYDDDSNVLQSKVQINRHGQGINEDYTIEFKYEFYD